MSTAFIQASLPLCVCIQLKGTPTTMGTRATSAAPCIYFSRGTCTRGEACLFSHTPSTDPLIPRFTAFPKAPCKFFLSGLCRNGDQCQFHHPPQNRNLNRNLHRPSADVTGGPLTGTPPDSWRSQDGTSWRSGARTSTLGFASSPCKFFVQGRCTKGAQCPFPHVKSGNIGVPVVKVRAIVA